EEVPTDTSIWYETIGTYVPDSNYTFLVVGNFFANGNFTSQVLDSTGYGSFYVSYAFVDDVRVSFDLQYCQSTGMASSSLDRTMRAYPQPFVNELNVQLDGIADGVVRWTLLDVEGLVCRSGASTDRSRQLRLSTGPLAPGFYVLRVSDDSGAYTPLRLISVSP
ncbi:MAG: T9SS type A sorting domain-containing protein, partial [Flavobacteriales bacterium]|nr:T9SS type A sorting domain-containing protein [Flavobacteriales bacterium]